jgi:DNA-binding beta-propeller fold protein YncE
MAPWALLIPVTLLLSLGAAAAEPRELLYVSEGNRLRRYDPDTIDRGPLLSEIVFENAETDPRDGRDINGMVCDVPGAFGVFVAGEDTNQPSPPAGWGVITDSGFQVGKLTPTYLNAYPEPYGCAFDAAGRLFTTSVGRKFFGGGDGQLIVWFPPLRHYPGPVDAYPDTDAVSGNACKLATDLGTALGVAVDDEGRVYVAAASGREVVRFSPPFPTSASTAGGCGASDATGAPMADRVQRERFLGPSWRNGLVTYSGLALSPSGTLYVSSVATGRIAEFDLEGAFVRMILDPGSWLPPYETGNPQGIAVDSRGTLYYVDLDLTLNGFSVGPGPDGKLWRIRFGADGAPLAPDLVARGLEFPDAVSVLPGDLEAAAHAGVLKLPTVSLAKEQTDRGSVTGFLLVAAVVLVTLGAVALSLLRRPRPFQV